ncbi:MULTISPECIES: HAD-IIIC family phosphatase [Bacteroides]|jgi:FkbH-like protein|uniref:HAD-IIIC family phosphatase n=1 Tax=Bacteroides TaxID=816 RepID=UPI001CAA7EDE|nr:HAD-IIIC family phosphatase [Bacteroides fragilis]MBY2901434.1 hypothetical protein [Bacteroides fragilis]
MKYFIFRNNTLENLFGMTDVGYSGYDDISYVPLEVDSYVWFYQVPIKFDIDSLTEEVNGYFDKLQIVYKQLPAHSQLIVFSLENLYNLNFCSTNYELKNSIIRFNMDIRDFCNTYANVKFIDFSEFLSDYPKDQWIDWKYYFLSQMVINPKLAGAFRKWFTCKTRELALSRKKCLVLDLDNTLWSGVLGEDGIGGIGIGGDYPGKAFLYFQEALIELSKQGVILTVCSKNNEADVLEAWKKNPFIKLNQKYLSAYRINWQNKADNIKELAQELNIGLDSFVFVDDNPTERELVKQLLPMVEVPDFPKHPYLLPVFFFNLVERYFRVYAITEEDKKKTEQYKANVSRTQEKKKFTDLGAYLASLEIEVTVTGANEFNIPRIAQMTQKTNQFNLTTKRYTDVEIRSLIEKGWSVFCISVKDKFGDNGITGAIILEPLADGMRIDSLLLSCRILGKGIELAFVRFVLNRLHSYGVGKIYADYYPTLKNTQVADFYDRVGFDLSDQKEDGTKAYVQCLSGNYQIESYYKINMN